MNTTMDQITALAKRRGFIFPGSDLYGGLANTYDYGPMGTELLRNIKNLWWKNFVIEPNDIVGIDTGIISHHSIWEASGHVASFADAMVDCKNCRLRIRADHLVEAYLENTPEIDGSDINGEILTKEEIKKILETKKVEGLSVEKLEELIGKLEIPCPNCKEVGRWTSVRKFNQLFPVQLGLIEGEGGSAYLRGETAQGIFINFKNVMDSNRVKLPFGIAQIGKSFRNEITPGNSVFRTIEFEQGEIEYFFDPEVTKWQETFTNWKGAMWQFITEKLGVRKDSLRWREHPDEERSFYSKKTEDLEYEYPFGFKEIWGIAYRTDYDLKQHTHFSGKDLSVTDAQTGKKVIPHVIEPAVGINRLFLMVLVDSFVQEENRTVLKLSPLLSPVKVAVFPLLGNKPELINLARNVFTMLKKDINGIVQWDERGNIGKRYLAQDEVGTPYCITIDFQSLEDNTVTVRDRDSAKQERVLISKLVSFLAKGLS